MAATDRHPQADTCRRPTRSVSILCLAAGRGLTPRERQILRALPADVGAGCWLTAAGVEAVTGIPERVAGMTLWRLHARRLVAADALYPPAYSRTLWGDAALLPGIGGKHASGPPRRGQNGTGGPRS
jgi:hypothetical protein